MKHYKAFEEFLKKRRRYLVQGGVATPHLSWYPAYHGSVSLSKLAPGFGFASIIVVFQDQGNRMNWIFDAEEFGRKGEDLMRKPIILKRLYKEWHKRESVFYHYIKMMERRKFEKNLIEEYKTFGNVYGREYTPALITEYFTVWGQRFVEDLLKKYSSYQRISEDIAVLTQPPHLSFMQEEERDLLKIARTVTPPNLPFKRGGNQQVSPPLGGGDLEGVWRALKKHAQKYFWFQNNYKRTDPLPVSYFEKRMREIVSTQSEGQILARLKELAHYEGDRVLRKRHVRATTKLRKSDQKKLVWLGFIAAWQDRRKKANLIANYWINEFLKIGAKKLGATLTECQFLLPDEFIDALTHNQFPRALVRERLAGLTHIQFSDGIFWMLTGKDHLRSSRTFLAFQEKATPVIKGLGVSAGLVRGQVFKVEDPSKEGRKFPKGAILVTYMTRPDFLPLMKHARAIVTDEGGVTSHAAIVARELKITCVVGTRIAMRVLKDGDRVEVDAEAGIVKKLS